MGRRLHKVLNSVLPMGLRVGLRNAARPFIPSLRHLDMPVRLRHVASLGFQPKVIYDIGAATGEWSRMAHGIWPNAKIVGFEPNARERPHLEATKRDIPTFDYRQCFLGKERKVVEYFDNDTQTSLLDDSAKGVKTKSEMRVLDEMIASGEIPPPEFLKLDVQGFELEVLSGGERAMASAEAALLEVNVYHLSPGQPVVMDVLEFMRARGFEWYDVMGLLRRPADDAMSHWDFFFVRRTSPLWRDSWV